MGESREKAFFHDGIDEFKLLAMAAGLAGEAKNMQRLGFGEIISSRGETAQVIDYGELAEFHGAFVNEELGTKNIIADDMHELTGKNYYFPVGIDTAASQLNDISPVGAEPISSQAHFQAWDHEWFNDPTRNEALVEGYAEGCRLAGAKWIGGETGVLPGIIEPGRIALSGSAHGVIYPKSRYVSGEKLQSGDLIVYLPSTGIHANGATFARQAAETLKDSYLTIQSDGTTFGESLLVPTPIYADAVQSLFMAGVDIHYMSNITGHGWRKIMRANQDLTYVISFLPQQKLPVFDTIQRQLGWDDRQMYGEFNMGMGFAFYIGKDQLALTLGTLQKKGWPARLAGHVEEGPRRVIIEPKDIEFGPDDLNIR